MKFSTTAILGTTFLALCISTAKADTIKTTGSTATSGITATGIQINGVLTSGAHKNQAPGTVTGTSTGIFSAFTSGTTMYYTPELISGNPAFHFDGTLSDGASVAHPVHLYEITSGSKVLDLYLTSVNPASIVKAATNAQGGFTATGYITLSGYSIDIPVTFTLEDNSKGSGKQAFTTTLDATLPAPEPSGLALLGTGILTAAGLRFRRFRHTA